MVRGTWLKEHTREPQSVSFPRGLCCLDLGRITRPLISAACSVASAVFKFFCGVVIINLDIAVGGSLTRRTSLHHTAESLSLSRVPCELVGSKPRVRTPPWSSYKGTPPHPLLWQVPCQKTKVPLNDWLSEAKTSHGLPVL